MKNFYMIFFTIVFFTSNAFGYSCYFRPYSGDIRVADINGRQIYTLFTTHLFCEYKEFHNILDLDIDILEKVVLWYNFLREYADTIDSERSDFQQVSSLLTSQRIDIEWIGVEYPPMVIKERVQLYQYTRETLNLYGNIGLWNQQKTDDMLYLLHPVWVKFLAEYPNDVVLDGKGRVRVIPLENKDSHMRAQELVESSIQRNEEIFYNMNITDEQRDAFFGFINAHHEKEPFLSINSQELEDFFRIHRIENPEAIRELRDYVDLENEFKAANQERDVFVVKSILDQEGNGIVLRGSAHQENVESGLTQACLESTRSL